MSTSHHPDTGEGRRALVVPVVVALFLGLGATAMVAASLRRPELPTYPVTPPSPREVGAVLDTATLTIDASAEGAWRFFDFSRGAVVPAASDAEWDLAFRRFDIMVNGGEAFAGGGGALDLGDVAFEEVEEVPADGYRVTEPGRDSAHVVMGDWYDYGFTSHLLRPKDRTYALRTADGRYAKLRILSYYCPGARPGCLTLRYAYQGDGSRRVVP
ncbi:MAG: HmuY family protein [Gemmatimonadetes bacterium]|nr:HmuY family protein [Gemmatimonadota bacterium]